MRDQSNRLLPFWAKDVSIPYRMEVLPFTFTHNAQRIWTRWQTGVEEIAHWQVLDPFPEHASRSLDQMVSEEYQVQKYWDSPNLVPGLLDRLKGKLETDQFKIHQVIPATERNPRTVPESCLMKFFNIQLYAEGLIRFQSPVEVFTIKGTKVRGLLLPVRPSSEMKYWVAEFLVGNSFELVLLEALSGADLGAPCWIAIWTHGQRTLHYLEKPALWIDPNWPLLPRVIAYAKWTFRFHRTHPDRDIQKNS